VPAATTRMTHKADRPKPLKERVDGVLLLDKPVGISSNAALQRARRTLGAAKAGHTGTLDPLASGLLPLAFGESTKFSQSLLDADKAYEAIVRLGVTTTTGDAEGAVLETRPVDVAPDAIVAIASRFLGEIEQLPPMFSALKHAGKPLYAYAREGIAIDIERKRRRVTIHALSCTPIDATHFALSVRCSKGTYVRTLGEDIGHVLGCGGHLTALRRTAIGRFRIEDAVPLATVEAAGLGARALLQPVDSLIDDLPVLGLSSEQAGAILHGQCATVAEHAAGDYRLYHETQFIGLGDLAPDGVLRSRRLCAGALDD